jgi:hypothetical protein
MEKHCRFLMEKTGAVAYKLLPAKALFTLGVGHVRRRGLEPGARSDEPGAVQHVDVVELTALEWRILEALKRELAVEEVRDHPWAGRAEEAGVSLEEFVAVAHDLNRRRVIGRFSTFLEHYKPNAAGERVTRYNALFHWKVPPGKEMEAGREVGRHFVMTHAYWREGGPEFGDVNVMGVAHGTEKDAVLAHKAAIDRHLEEASKGTPAAGLLPSTRARSTLPPGSSAFADDPARGGLPPRRHSSGEPERNSKRHQCSGHIQRHMTGTTVLRTGYPGHSQHRDGPEWCWWRLRGASVCDRSVCVLVERFAQTDRACEMSCVFTAEA